MFNLNEQYNVGLLPYILQLTQAQPSSIVVWFDDIVIAYYYYLLNYVLYLLSFVFVVFGGCIMAINVSVQFNGGSLPNIILLTQGYYHCGTHLNAMKRLYF